MRSHRTRRSGSSTRRAFLQTTGSVVPSIVLLTHDAAAQPVAKDPTVPDETPHTVTASERGQYEAAYQRLKDRYSLERVHTDRIEVGWDDLVGMAVPLSRQIPIQACNHYQRVFLHADMSVTLGRDAGSMVLGFGVGPTVRWPDLKQVTRRLHKGYQPIVESEWRTGDIRLEQTALTFLPDAERVTTGRESQWVALRMKVTNLAAQGRKTALHLFVGAAGTMRGHSGGHLTSLSGMVHGASHWPFTASRQRWKEDAPAIMRRNQGLYVGDQVMLTFKGSGATQATFREQVSAEVGAGGCADVLRNCLSFDVSLGPNETKEIEIVATPSQALSSFVMKDYYTKRTAVDPYRAMTAVVFTDALRRAEAMWDGGLAGAMRLTTPEPRLNDIYKGLILSGYGCLGRSPEHDWVEPYQTPFLWEVLPWEQAYHVNALAAIGLTETAAACLRFFTAQQVGVGPQSANHGPLEAKAIAGSYPGQASGDWMNFTGSTLWMLATYYHYTRDATWLKQNAPGILAAWAWVQGERERTRTTGKDGKKAAYHGLLPPGRAGDWPEGSYLFTFTDNYTWYGMSEIARAFRHASLPEAARLTKEADEYRQCILDVMHDQEVIDPETQQLLVPNAVFYKDGYKASWWMADGPIQMFRTGFLKPADKRFESTYAITKHKHGVLLGMHETYGHPEWYNTQTDHTFYNCYLVRREFEKAILTFYSVFVYGLSHDCLQTQERTNVLEPNYGTYNTNASNIGRLLGMMKTMVIDEQEPDQLWLLRGCPRRWFAAGQAIEVAAAPTESGPMAITVRSGDSDVRVDLTLPPGFSGAQRPVFIRVPRPTRQAIRRVALDGQDATFDAVNEVVELRGIGEGSHAVVVHY